MLRDEKLMVERGIGNGTRLSLHALGTFMFTRSSSTE